MNGRFNSSLLCINVHKMSFRPNSMMFYNFVNFFNSLSPSVFEIRMLSSKLPSRWRRRRFHLIAHGYFTIPKHHFYENSSSVFEIKRVARDFNRQYFRRLKAMRLFYRIYYLQRTKEILILRYKIDFVSIYLFYYQNFLFWSNYWNIFSLVLESKI